MLCVVSHDAGGAEILSSYIRQKSLSCVYSLSGPATKIFNQKLKLSASLPLMEALSMADELLCGTSWQSDLEWEAIALARKAGKRSVAFLDHWVNYRERFIRNGIENLPDELWVGDAEAESLALHLFPSIPVRLIANPYFEDLRKTLYGFPLCSNRNTTHPRILYVCEPVREHALNVYGNERHWGYTEEDALDFFLTNCSVIGTPIDRIVVRPHPSEVADKYDWVYRNYDLPLYRGGHKTLFEEVAESDVLVGCESMAMVIGMLAGCRVISSIPPGGRACSLPHRVIESLQELVRQKSLREF